MGAVLWLKMKRMRTDVWMYLMMMLMAVLLSFIFGNAFFGDGTQRVMVSGEDGSEATEAFIGALESDAYSVTYAGKEEAETAVAKGEALAALVLPEGFSEKLVSGGAELTIVKSADSAEIMALENSIMAAAKKAAHVYMLYDSIVKAMDPAGLEVPAVEDVINGYEQRMDDNAAVKVNVTLTGSGGYEERFASNVHYLMGFNIFLVMFSIVFTVGAILEDKKLRTWNRIRISPLPGSVVLAGNFIPAFVVGFVQMAIVLVLGQLMFGMDFGLKLWPILLVFAAFALTSTCLGLLLSSLFNTYEQLNAGTPVILVATAMLGGCMWPLSIVGSDILLGIANAMPQKWALEAAESLALGANLSSVMNNILILFGMALVFFGISVVLYNKKQKA